MRRYVSFNSFACSKSPVPRGTTLPVASVGT
nr:MAG TPA: hypothetical protein [Caudoviricetes sp.]